MIQVQWWGSWKISFELTGGGRGVEIQNIPPHKISGRALTCLIVESLLGHEFKPPLLPGLPLLPDPEQDAACDQVRRHQVTVSEQWAEQACQTTIKHYVIQWILLQTNSSWTSCYAWNEKKHIILLLIKNITLLLLLVDSTFNFYQTTISLLQYLLLQP